MITALDFITDSQLRNGRHCFLIIRESLTDGDTKQPSAKNKKAMPKHRF